MFSPTYPGVARTGYRSQTRPVRAWGPGTVPRARLRHRAGLRDLHRARLCLV